MDCRDNVGIALGKRRKGGSDHESVKPISGVQLVQVQPGQSRSGQAGSECCHSPGDWRVRSVHSKEAGREDSAPKSFSVANADAVNYAQGRIRMPVSASCQESPESLARGMLTKGSPVNPGELSVPSRWAWSRPTQSAPGPWSTRVAPREANNPQRGKPVAKGNRRRQLRADEQSYEPIVPMKVENRRAPARGGHGIHWREGANRWTRRHSDIFPRGY